MRRLRAELGPSTHVIATGGLAGVLVPFIRETIDEVDDLLTLTGLRLIWQRNQESAPARRGGIGTSGVRATVAARIRNVIRRRSSGCSAGVRVVVVEQAADRGEHGRVVDLVGHVTREPRQREHLGRVDPAHRGDRAEEQEERDPVEQQVRGMVSFADRRPGRLERLARGDAQRLPGRDRAGLLGAQPDLERPAQLEGGRDEGIAVRGVAGEHDLAGRHEREQRLEVGRDPPGGVEQQVREVGGDAPDPR